MPNKFDVKRCNVKGPDVEIRRGRAFYSLALKTLYVAKQDGSVMAIAGLPAPTQRHNQRNVWEVGPYTIDRKGCQTGCGGNRLATIDQATLIERAELLTVNNSNTNHVPNTNTINNNNNNNITADA